MTARSWGALSLVVLTTAAVTACGVRRPGPEQEVASATEFPEGWTELPLPPEVRDGAALVWTGQELIAWGGCDPARPEDCYPTLDGFAFDPTTRTWRQMPSAPAGGIDPEVVWTGREALFFYAEGWKLKGVAYDPEIESWRTLPNAPLQPRFGAVYVWTGSEAIVWGGGRPEDDLAATGAAYSPISDSWRPVADGPIGLNLTSGMWTGQEMLVFGSLLDHRNWAETDASVGAAYDPVTDSWRAIPPSSLSPQATSGAWTGDRMLAWDYGLKWQLYDPRGERWTRAARIPLEPQECYPDSAVVDGLAFAFYCGDAALFDPKGSEWRAVHGGPMEQQIEANGAPYDLWRFADLVAANDMLFLEAEGITAGHGGTPCYGCADSPHSFWAYRPPASVGRR